MHPFFKITDTQYTDTGSMHRIAWNWYFNRKFLESLSRYAINLGWFQSGDYSIKHVGKKTEVTVSDRILKEFSELLEFIAKKYKN